MHNNRPGNARHEIKIVELSSPGTDDRGGVKLVLVIETRHRILFFRALELGKAGGQCWPDDLLEIFVVNFKVVASRLIEGWYAAGVAFSLWAKCQPMDILDVRERLDLFRGFEVMLIASHRLHRDRPSPHCADLLRPSPRSVCDPISFYSLPRFQPNCSKPAFLGIQPHDLL